MDSRVADVLERAGRNSEGCMILLVYGYEFWIHVRRTFCRLRLWLYSLYGFLRTLVGVSLALLQVQRQCIGALHLGFRFTVMIDVRSYDSQS